MDPSSRLKHALETRDAPLTLLRAKGEWMARGDIPFLMIMELGLTLARRTPFQRMPKETERAKYMRALDGRRVRLPYVLAVWAPNPIWPRIVSRRASALLGPFSFLGAGRTLGPELTRLPALICDFSRESANSRII